MQRFARLAGDTVAEIIALPDGVDIASAFHPEIVATCRPCEADVAPGWILDGDDLAAPPPPPPPTKAQLIARLKDLRWQREIAGVTVTIGGEPVLVSTARGDDRAALHQEFSAIGAGLRPEGSPFNFADGVPRAVSNADMQAAILAALAHVRAAFDLELTLTPEIEAEEITTFAEVEAAFV